MKFWLGTHRTDWLAKTDVPLFISRIRLQRRKRALPRALGPWALDSGGFSELDQTGRWSITPREYVALVRRYRDEIGNLQWAAIMDWMCEPRVREKTQKSVEEHQQLTIDNYKELLNLAPELPWVPVLQGWGFGDYWRHVDAYERAGFNLKSLPLVGVGSVCRRQSAISGPLIVSTISDTTGIKLHGFGFKLTGLDLVSDKLTSADSMAWSFAARKRPPLPGCTHQACNNCLKWALKWRSQVLPMENQPSLLERVCGKPQEEARNLFNCW